MEVQKRVNYIITQEHIKISPENVNTIIASTDGDMRQVYSFDRIQEDIDLKSIANAVYPSISEYSVFYQ